MHKQEMYVWYYDENDRVPSYLDFDLRVVSGIVQSPTVEIEGSHILINGHYAIAKGGVEVITVTYTPYARPRTMSEMDRIKSDVYLIESDKVQKVSGIRDLLNRGDILISLYEAGKRVKHKQLYRF